MTAPRLVLLVLCFVISINPAFSRGNWIPVGNNMPAAPSIEIKGEFTEVRTLSVKMGGFYLSEIEIAGKIYQWPSSDGLTSIGKEGYPELPRITVSLLVPDLGNIRYTVKHAEYTDFPNMQIAPSAGYRKQDAQHQPVFGPAYHEDAFFPSAIYEQSAPFIIRNQRGTCVTIYPFSYNPVQKILRVYHQMEIIIEPVQEASVNELTPEDSRIKTWTGFDLSRLGNQRVNSQKSSAIDPGVAKRMLVICPSQFNETIRPFIRWKHESGIYTELVAAENFTDAKSLKEFIKQYYYASEDLAYVLLVGDAGLVPTCQLPYGSSDNYYGCVAGDDHYPDIMVGRFSAESTKELKVQVEKTIEYERQPFTGASWLDKAMGIGSEIGPGDDYETDFQHLRNMLNELKTSSYSGYFELYDGSQGGEDADGNPTSQLILDKVNQGVGLILYAGHGSPNMWGTGMFSKSAVDFLKNKGMYPVIISAACENGNFAENYCMAEAWMRAHTSDWNPLGAVAALMSSSAQTVFPPMEGQDQMIHAIAGAGNPEGLKTLGNIVLFGLYKLIEEYAEYGNICSDTWILFGDPSLAIRTAQPQNFLVAHDRIIGTGMKQMDINASSLQACSVSLTQDEAIIASSSVTQGKAKLQIPSSLGGNTVNLTVTGYNLLPYSAAIEIIDYPLAPETYIPVNHSRMEPIRVTFAWDKGKGSLPDEYILNVGTNYPPDNLIKNLIVKDTFYICPEILAYQNTYYWSVESVNTGGKSSSEIKDFTTLFAPDDDFESSVNQDLPWITEGEKPWKSSEQVFFKGNKAMQSGAIGDNSYSVLRIVTEVKNCDFISFWTKVSSEASADKLSFYIDQQLQKEWSGEAEWTYSVFTVSEGIHEFVWKYQKDAQGSAGNDAAWIDDVHLPMHGGTMTEFSPDAGTCSNTGFNCFGKAEYFNSITWESSGDGHFDDINLQNPVYTPGSLDRQSGNTWLYYNVKGYPGCPVVSGIIKLEIHKAPDIALPEDTLVNDVPFISLDAENPGCQYLWLPGENTSRICTFDSTGSVNGTKTISVQVSDNKGCTDEQILRLHFSSPAAPQLLIYPNPASENITIESKSGPAELKSICLKNSSGGVVSMLTPASLLNQASFSLPSLPDGYYFLEAVDANSNNISAPLIIKNNK